jgi:hypothetical protein
VGQGLVQETECSRFVPDDLLRLTPANLVGEQVMVDGERIVESVKDQRAIPEELEPLHRRSLVNEKIWPDYIDAYTKACQIRYLR